MTIANRNSAWATALAQELARSGVEHVCISPGSRSAPLAIACANQTDLCDHSILDERSAGFFALGLARASASPVALICTSGTAAANYLPAVIEAYHGQTPLIVLTADRPIELRDCGAGQTIDQLNLYGAHVRYFAELPTPELKTEVVHHLRTKVCRAVAAACQTPSGPVHLNIPLREPLSPEVSVTDQAAWSALPVSARNGRDPHPFVQVPNVRSQSADITAVLKACQSTSRGLIIVGENDACDSLRESVPRLAKRLGWPWIDDVLSPLRSGVGDRGFCIEAHDSVFRSDDFIQQQRPELVLRFGRMPTSKAIRTWLEAQPGIRQIVVTDQGWLDPTQVANWMIPMTPAAFVTSFESALRSSPTRLSDTSTRSWIDAGHRAEAVLNEALGHSDEVSEPAIARIVFDSLPADGNLVVASSMPVRDLNQFAAARLSPIRVLANRGANGIDGTVSTALGIAAGSQQPTALICGDLAFLHDLNAWLIARQTDAHLTAIVIDNGGGGIFEFLPLSSNLDRPLFEKHFGTKQNVDPVAALEGLGISVREVTDLNELRTCLNEGWGQAGIRAIVARTNRAENRELHRKISDAVGSALG